MPSVNLQFLTTPLYNMISISRLKAKTMISSSSKMNISPDSQSLVYSYCTPQLAGDAVYHLIYFLGIIYILKTCFLSYTVKSLFKAYKILVIY